ncbi:putative O-methyltransferase [Hypoxylon cercidicola]|nr:putative O-methyltransferase [Hypoxylon cercidicola]
MAVIENLASSISEQVSTLSSLLQEAGSAPPTFAEAGFGAFSYEEDIQTGKSLRETRSKILDATQDLIQLIRGPIEHVLTLAWPVNAASIDLITRLMIPQRVPVESSISIQDLAVAVNVTEPLLVRVVRYAIANHLFQEEPANIIRHSASSAAWVHNPCLANTVHFGTEFLGNILMKVPDAVLLKRDNPAHAVHAAFNIAHGTDETLFEYLHNNENLTRKYHEYLARRGKVAVVDVGGSSGHTIRALAPLMPDATVILKSRISFAEYDFLKPQPVKADIYIYQHILHDWSDEDSLKILSSQLPALKPGAIVLISEAIVPDRPAKRLSTLASKMVRIEDQFVLAAHDAYERTVADFESLFQKLSPGNFRLVGVTWGTEAGAF